MEHYYPGHPAGGSKVEQDVGLLGDLPLQQPPLRADLASPQFALVCDGKAADQHRDRDGDDHHPADGAQPAKYLTHYCLGKVSFNARRLYKSTLVAFLRLQVVPNS